MTDLTPNDLSHLSDEEFNALAPQGHHAPGPEPLSPAAQAIIDAIGISPGSSLYAWIAAATLRAAADQLTPYSVNDVPGAAFCRNKLLSIAAELECQ